MKFDPRPVDCVSNWRYAYSLINSVAFHPRAPVFCATFSTRDLLCIYRVLGNGRVVLAQRVQAGGMSGPQHAVYAPRGDHLLVVNWGGESFSRFACSGTGHVEPASAQVQQFPDRLAGFKPHGMEFSPSGRHLLVVFGAATAHPKGLASFRVDDRSGELQLVSLVDWQGGPGIPKGVCFTPDGSHVVVTFSNTDRVRLHRFDAAVGAIASVPAQELHGPPTGLVRPEDAKFTADGRHLVVSNSGADTVAFYPFDPVSNRVKARAPEFLLGGPRGPLAFPHGLAVSADGRHLAVSQFGPLPTTDDEDIVFGRQTPATQARIWLYRQSRPGLAPRRGRIWASRVRDLLAPRN